MKPKQRDIYLVPYPFSNLSDTKVRPVIILSNDAFNENSRDVVVCGITSNLNVQRYSLQIEGSGLEEGKLRTSMVRMQNLLKIEQRLLIKKIARLNQEKYKEGILLLENLVKLI